MLFQKAWAAQDQAYAPYSGFRVGAALLTESGEVYCGCNVENASYGLTICAERNAVSAAIQGGCRKFLGIAIATDTEKAVAPCGGCLQFLAEFAPVLPIHSTTRGYATMSWLLAELLSAPFHS